MQIAVDCLTKNDVERLVRRGYVVEIDGDSLFANVYKQQPVEQTNGPIEVNS